MIEFFVEALLLLPFLFATYLVLETIESRANGTLERILGRARLLGPIIGSLAGAIPQCGVSASVASLFAGGVVTVATLIAVFLSTSDELIPVLISKQLSFDIVSKIFFLKIIFAMFSGVIASIVLKLFKFKRRAISVEELCEHSHCGCKHGRGIFLSSLIHTAEIFVFILVVSGLIELAMHFFGEGALANLILNRPFLGEFIAGAIGLVPNCAISVAVAELYCNGAMSSGALMASSFTGAGVGWIVLFRTNRSIKENLAILLSVYLIGSLLGFFAGFLI